MKIRLIKFLPRFLTSRLPKNIFEFWKQGWESTWREKFHTEWDLHIWRVHEEKTSISAWILHFIAHTADGLQHKPHIFSCKQLTERAGPPNINGSGLHLENVINNVLSTIRWRSHAEFVSFFYSHMKKVRKTARASLHILQKACLLIVLNTVQQSFLYFLPWFPP